MSEYQIADGWDNAAGLVALETLDPPLFAGYADGVLSEWHDAEAMVWSGDRRRVAVGRAWAAWRFFRLSREEMAYLRANFGEQVTIRTLDKGADAFAEFNATLVLPDPAVGWEADGWDGVRVEFRDLVAI